MSKIIPAVLDAKGNVIVPEYELLPNGVRVLDGVQYGRGKHQSRDKGCRRVVSNTVGSSMTKQSFAADAHIGNIVKRAFAGMPVTQMPARNPEDIYLDVSNLPSYQESLNLVIATENVFNSLDAVTRQKFGNDPSRMLDFVADPANKDAAVQLGLIAADSVSPAEPIVAAEGGVDAPTGAQGSGA